jgi:hypothetical protein
MENLGVEENTYINVLKEIEKNCLKPSKYAKA